MTIIRDLEHCPDACKGAVIALGNFDGVHLGHESIIAECMGLAKTHGAPSAVMTFEPHPRQFFSPSHESLRIYSLKQKIELLRDYGIEHIFLMRFNGRLAATSADDFVNLLHKQLAVTHIVTGYNFAFGKGRAGDTQFLTEKARALNFGFTAHAQINTREGKTISSTAIRQALKEGDMPAAAAMLGRLYAVCGHVAHGEKRGRQLGFPTLNLPMSGLFKPRFGVYAARVRLQGDGRLYNAVANIGIKPTFGVSAPLLEAHCFGLAHEVYGRYATVELTAFIREERKFPSLEALKIQIAEDGKKAEALLHG